MRSVWFWWLLAAAVGLPSAAHAETLEQTLVSVYRNNPRILAARASLRALDENVARANSEYRPSITAGADIGYQTQKNKPRSLGTNGTTHPRGYGVTAVQSLFNGFQTANRVKSAKAGVRSGRASLLSLEQEVLLETIGVYVDVLRDETIVRIQQKHLNYITGEVAATRRRKSEGQVTRTDLSQSIARRAAALTRLQAAQGSLRISRANFERLVGHPPSGLEIPARQLLKLPRSLKAAVSIGRKYHPEIVAALEEVRVAEHNLQAIRGELLPNAQLQMDYSRDYDPSTFTDRSDTFIAQGRVNIPIYTGGEVEARVRQAKHTKISRLQNVSQVRLQVTANIEQAWAQMQVAKAQRRSIQLQVNENKKSLSGVRKEERFGQRTVAEVLNAADALVNAQVSLTSNYRTFIVSSYSVLTAIGKLNMENLKLTGDRYDPKVNYEITKRRWGGLSITYPDGRKERVR
ncbi:MAG: TolC family outer membrane protein [Hyphomicrobiaceae bacterium]